MCQSCKAVMINGVYCHERGCPDAWRDKRIACWICGYDFAPKERGQCVCSDCKSDEEGEDDNDAAQD